MKTKHRRELKENDVVRVVGATREFAEHTASRSRPRSSPSSSSCARPCYGVLAWRNRQQAQGQDLLAQAMVVLNTAVVPVTADDQAGRCAGRGVDRREGDLLDRGAEAERRAAEAAGGGRRVSGDGGRHAGAVSPRGHARGARSGRRRRSRSSTMSCKRAGAQTVSTDGWRSSERPMRRRRPATRCGDRHLERARREEGREPARGRDPDAARRAPIRRRATPTKRARRSRDRRQSSRFAVRRGGAQRARVAQGLGAVQASVLITSFSDSKSPTAFRWSPCQAGVARRRRSSGSRC